VTASTNSQPTTFIATTASGAGQITTSGSGQTVVVPVLESSTSNPKARKGVAPSSLPDDLVSELRAVRKTPLWKKMREDAELLEALGE
jgi:hypothetical protein